MLIKNNLAKTLIVLLFEIGLMSISCSGVKYLDKNAHLEHSALLKVELKIAKNVFNADENIEGTLIFTNTDTCELYINARFYTGLEAHPVYIREIYFEKYKDCIKYEPLYYTYEMIWKRFTKQNFLKLEPGQMITCSKYIWRPVVIPMEKGQYKVCAVYENYYTVKSKSHKTFTGLVKSNFVYFEIE